MAVLLALPYLKSGEHEETGDALRVTAEVTVRPVACPYCRRQPVYSHGTQSQEYADAPIRGKPVRILIDRRRYRCPHCSKTFFEPLVGFSQKRAMTQRLVLYIGRASLSYRPFAEVARETGLDIQTIRHIFLDFSEMLRQRHPLPTPRVLGIDEAKRAGAVRTVLTNLEERCYFDLLPSHTLKTLRPYFKALPHKHKIEVVAMDLLNVFQMVIAEELPQAVIVADKYHVVRMANEVLEKVNRQVRRDLPRGQRLALFRQRGRLSTRGGSQVSPDPQLERVFEQYPLLGAAWGAKEAFYEVYEANDRQEAAERIDAWLKDLDQALTPFFKPLISALSTRRGDILNYFDHRYTNAFTEAANGISKMLERRGRGYGFEVMRVKLLYGKKAQKMKDQEFLIEQGDQDRNMIGYINTFGRAGATHTKRITLQIPIGPGFDKVATLADAGYYDGDDVAHELDAYLHEFVKRY